MKKLASMALMGLTLLSTGTLDAQDHNEDEISIFIPAFSSTQELGRSVATIMNLQIFTTLRKAPTPNPENLDFGDGLVVWTSKTLPESSYDAAEKAAKRLNILAQLVLWGDVDPYVGGAIAQTYLSVPKYRDFRRSRLEVWDIRIPLPEENELVFTLDFAKRRYAFEPIIIPQELIDLYSNPSAIKMHEQRNGTGWVQALGPSFTALRHEAEEVKVRSRGRDGWVQLPALSKNRSEVTDFTAGVIRILRGDWQGARRLFQSVLDNQHVSNELKIDALLFQTFAKNRLGMSASDEIAAALKMNPNARRSVSVAMMLDLDKVSKAISGGHSSEEVSEILISFDRFVKENRVLFPKDDTWLNETLRKVGILKGSLH